VAHTASPALYTDNRLALTENAEVDGVLDTPLNTLVNIFLPWVRLEVGLLFGKVEGVDAAVEVGILGNVVSRILDGFGSSF